MFRYLSRTRPIFYHHYSVIGLIEKRRVHVHYSKSVCETVTQMTANTQSINIREEMLTFLLLSPNPERIADHFNQAPDAGWVRSMFRALSDVIQ